MKLKFKKEPRFAELWDACLYNLLYDTKKYVNEILKLFKKNKISKKSKIIDVSVGTGFPALELTKKGYKIDCMDSMQDEINVFSRKAKKKKLNLRCKKLTWLQIPKHYKKNYYDFSFCRGNSFIYAAGGWNKSQKVDAKKSLKLYEETLKIFYDLLKDGGLLYIDKFKDSEKPHKTKVVEIQIKDKKYDLIFYNEIKNKLNIRSSAMLLRDKTGKEIGLPNITYLLSKKELMNMLRKVGFSSIKEMSFKSEKHFDIILAKK
ncbi:MAG: methyltransferase domain-containing protein [Nanoarchaeota archaeon]|nr:methyltransferase domain-containing protein [Nanoarchaeota archaeon]